MERSGEAVRATILGEALIYCAWVNVTLGIFNMLPIYPMDGGQILYNASIGVGARERLAKSLTFFVAVIVGGLYLLYRARGGVDGDFLFSVLMIGLLLNNAYQHYRS